MMVCIESRAAQSRNRQDRRVPSPSSRRQNSRLMVFVQAQLDRMLLVRGMHRELGRFDHHVQPGPQDPWA